MTFLPEKSLPVFHSQNGSANNTHISFEICEPGGFKYSSGATMVGYDVKKNEEYFNNVYQKAVELCAYLCKKYDCSPREIYNAYLNELLKFVEKGCL